METNIIQRGLLIVFEGLDQSGKSTQSKLLKQYLQTQKMSTQLMAFPQRDTQIGKMINEYLAENKNYNDQLIHLLFSANRWEMIDQINKKMKEGTIFILDRYAYSGVVFSAAKGLDFEWCQTPDQGLPKPDLVFYMNIDQDTINKRKEFGNERYEVQEFQEKVRNCFDTLVKECDNFVIIDAKKDVSEISDIVKSNLDQLLISQINQTEPGKLWN